jgi:glycosyltransferase involved in cell wall biosynthesis
MSVRLAYDASSIRHYRSGIGHYTASLLDTLRIQFPWNSYLVLSHLAGVGFKGPNLIPTQRRSFPIKEIWMQLWLPRILAGTRPDLCHFTNNIAPMRAKFPYVLTVHDLSLIDHPEWHPWTRRIWMRRVMRPSVLKARTVLCASEATRQEILSWVPIDPERVQAIPLAPRSIFLTSCLGAKIAAVKARYGLNRPFILYVGNIEPRKNLPALLKAYRLLDPPDIDLVMAGRYAWLPHEFQREARNPYYHGRLHRLGYVPDEVLPALYQSALAFAYPSRMEGFGLPVLESMASGLPVLVSRIEPLMSLVNDAGWLADPEKPTEWASALDEIIRDPVKRVQMAERGKERSANYSWSQTAEATMRCYESALS